MYPYNELLELGIETIEDVKQNKDDVATQIIKEYIDKEKGEIEWEQDI
jgi:hypothetical protein